MLEQLIEDDMPWQPFTASQGWLNEVLGHLPKNAVTLTYASPDEAVLAWHGESRCVHFAFNVFGQMKVTFIGSSERTISGVSLPEAVLRAQAFLLSDDTEKREGWSFSLEELRALEEGWDDFGSTELPAPVPSEVAVLNTRQVIEWANIDGLLVSDVDADVIGGTAVFLEARRANQLSVWIHCMNSGHMTAVGRDGIQNGGIPWASSLTEKTWSDVIQFLSSSQNDQDR